jgi:ribosomal protein L37E
MSGYEGSVGTRASRACEFGGRVGSTTTANHRRISTDGSVGSIRMPERREPLCPQCGGVSYEQIDACHSRCSECGLGRTSQPLIAQAGATRSPASAPRSHERVHMADIAGRIRGAFADASFAPYGLDDRWQGTRWFGGSGSSGDKITRLELAHGENPWDETTTQVRVEARLPANVLPDDAQNMAIERSSLIRPTAEPFLDDQRHPVRRSPTRRLPTRTRTRRSHRAVGGRAHSNRWHGGDVPRARSLATTTG